MAFKIGFATEYPEENCPATYNVLQPTAEARKSVVQVYFAGRGMTLAYYNDRFDLHPGDKVYVDGKLEGMLGRVVEVNYSFKIKLSDYKRVIAVLDTSVSGQLFIAGSHFVTFDRSVLPRGKVAAWFNAPTTEGDEFVSACDGSSFFLDDFDGLNISAEIAERGHHYFLQNRVKYISIDGTVGYAIVEGGENYEVEFEYRDGEIANLVCSCFCSYNCKHEFATMLQLGETLRLIGQHYADEYEYGGYFAAMNKSTLFNYAVDGKETGSVVFS